MFPRENFSLTVRDFSGETLLNFGPAPNSGKLGRLNLPPAQAQKLWDSGFGAVAKSGKRRILNSAWTPNAATAGFWIWDRREIQQTSDSGLRLAAKFSKRARSADTAKRS